MAKANGCKTPCEDHLGHKYNSIAEMCRAWGISPSMYLYRHEKQKWSLKKTLTTPLQDITNTTGMKCMDHKGNIFKSKKDMCDFWRIPRTVFFGRIRAGWSQKQALTTPVKSSPKQRTVVIKDHKGHEFANIDAMCEYWHVSKVQFMRNRKYGLNIKRALTETVPPDAPIKDHKGVEYPSFNKMLEAYGVTKNQLRSRIELGWDLKSILEHPDAKEPGRKIKDHEGREFKSIKEMLEYHDVSYPLYKHRKDIGLDMKTCLTKGNIHIIPTVDHHGLQFASILDMCTYWCLKPAVYYSRQAKGMDIRTCVLGAAMSFNRIPEAIKIKKELPGYYYLVEYEGHEYLWNDIVLYRHARSIRLEDEISRTKGQLSNGYTVRKKISRYYEIEKDDQSSILSEDSLFAALFLSAPPVKTSLENI